MPRQVRPKEPKGCLRRELGKALFSLPPSLLKPGECFVQLRFRPVEGVKGISHSVVLTRTTGQPQLEETVLRSVIR